MQIIKTIKNLNTITQWPYVHVCAFDLSCWCELWLFGSPIRVHYRKEHFWDVPGPWLWLADRRRDQLWGPPSR